jgi:hypothetical protein
LLIISALFFVYIFIAVRKKALLLRDSLLWMLMALVMLLLAIFPGIAVWLSELIGIETPSNLVFFAALIMVLVLLFRQTAAMSKMTTQIARLTQEIALMQVRDDTHRED